MQKSGGAIAPMANPVDRLQKMTRKSKRNKNLRSFRAVFNSRNCADKEKDKSNYRFPSIVKNNGKEGLKLLKAKDLTETA